MTAVSFPVHALVQDFCDQYPEELATLVETIPPKQIVELLEAHEPERAGQILSRLRLDVLADTIVILSDSTLRRMSPFLDTPRVAPAIARLDAEARRQILGALDPGKSRDVAALITYPSDVAGGLMDPMVGILKPEQEVRDALVLLRKLRHKQVHVLYVVDDDEVLIGRVRLLDVAVANPSDRIDGLMSRDPVNVPATAPRAQVVEALEEHGLASIPVVDFDGRLIGVIRHRTLVAAAAEELSAGMQQMVGVSRDERALSPVSFAVKRRLPWLNINLLTAFLAASVVGLFESTIAQFTALAVLLPVVAGQSGNTGAQALAVTMRGLALREIRVAQWLRVSGKELSVGFVNGIAVAVVTGFAVLVWSDSTGLAAVISISMVMSMTIASLAGATIPMILTTLGQDPAQAASIVLTTVTDVVGFFSFLGLATLGSSML